MNILQITSVYYPELQFGGPPQKIHALSRGLLARGHQVQVITHHSQVPTAKGTASYDEVAVQYLPWWGRGHWQVPRRWQALIAHIQAADVVHVYGLYNGLGPLAVYYAQRLGRPVVVEPQGMYVPRVRHQRLKQLYHQLFTASMLRVAALVIATSSAEAAELKALVRSEQLVIRRNGIALDHVTEQPPATTFRAEHGIQAHEHLVLYIGRISPIKNLGALIQAVAKVTLPIRLVLVGPLLEADYAHELRTLINALQMEEQVLLTGPLYDQEKGAALAAADLFVLPSLFESYGNAAAEAVAAGLPVLLSTGCGIAATIHGRAGYAVAPTTEGLAAGLQQMLGDKAIRNRMYQEREALLAELSWAEPLQQMEELYQRVIAQKRMTGRTVMALANQ